MERLRTPFFLVSLGAAILVILVETGARFLVGGPVGGHDAGAALAGQAAQLGVATSGGGSTPPGLGMPYLALVDAVVLFTVGLMGVGLLTPQRVQGRVQGVATLVFGILLVLGALALLAIAILKLILMVTLLFAFPFGTIAYLIIWGGFPRGTTMGLLSVVMFLKLVFAVFLLLAQPRFIQNVGLILLTLTSLVCNVVLAFLQGIVPGILVSITDALGAIVFAIVAAIWALVLLFGSIPGIVLAVESTAAGGRAAIGAGVSR
jgi:hypothetical protein